MSETAEAERQRGFVTLDSCIRSAIMDIGDTMHRYEQFKHWAIEGYRDFHFDQAQEIKVVELSLTAWKAVELPVDYVDWAFIGIIVNNELQAFTNNGRISILRPDADEDGAPDAVTTEATHPADSLPIDRLWFWDALNANGEYKGQRYGLTVKDNGVGYYKFNKARNEIQFNAGLDTSTKVLLEYISDGYNPSERTVVNVYAAKLIKLYIHWQRHLYAKSSTGAEKKEAERLYYDERGTVQNRLNPITVEDVLECARDGYRLVSSF